MFKNEMNFDSIAASFNKPIKKHYFCKQDSSNTIIYQPRLSNITDSAVSSEFFSFAG